MELKLVVFDMDDTLYLERTYVESGFKAVDEMLAAEFGYQEFFDVAWNLFESGQRGDIFDVALRDRADELPSGIVRQCVDVYRRHPPEIRLLPDAKWLLERCKGDVATALVTDGPGSSQRAKIRSLELDRIHDAIVVTDEHGEGWQKPGSLAFRSLQDEFSVKGEECIYIGDNPQKDFISPRKLGWHAIRVRRRLGLHELAESSHDAALEIPDLSVGSLRQVDALGFLLT